MTTKTALRRNLITKLVQQQQITSVQRLARICQVSTVTIRKDLTALNASGILIRHFGGATAKSNSSIQLPTRSPYQYAIAKKAAQLIKDHTVIVLDSGTTTAALIPFLANKNQLIVMTNDLLIAEQITQLKSPPSLLVTGGTWDERSRSLQGFIAEQAVQHYDFAQLFIGADGLDFGRGTTTFNEQNRLSQTMANCARQTIVMIEADKIGRKMPNLEMPWSKIDILLTDQRLTWQTQAKLQQLPLQLIIAETITEVITPNPLAKGA